jgi:prohibitin 2
MDEQGKAGGNMAEENSDDKAGGYVKLAAIAVVLVFVLAAVLDSKTEIATGHVGIVTQYSAATGTVLQPGLHFITPFVQGVVDFDTHQQKLDVNKSYTSHDQQLIPTDATVTYQVNAHDVPTIYRNVGSDYADLAVVPNTDQALNLTLGRYDAEQLSTDKTAVANYFQTVLQGRLAQYHINVINVKLTTSYPEAYAQAIENKQVATQNVLAAQQALDKARIDAQQQVVQAQNKATAEITLAKADAQAQRLRLNNLSPLYIEYQFLQTWDGKLPTFMSGQLPFFTIPLTDTGTLGPAQ